MLSRELTNLVFTNIAFAASHTYSHWRRSPKQYPQGGEGASNRVPALKNLILQDESHFSVRDQPKKLQKNGSGVLAERGEALGLFSCATAYSKFRQKKKNSFIQAIGSLTVATVHNQFSLN